MLSASKCDAGDGMAGGDMLHHARALSITRETRGGGSIGGDLLVATRGNWRS